MDSLNSYTEAVRSLDRETHARRVARVASVWVAMAFMFVLCAASIYVLWNRPALIYVVAMHDDGSYDPPVLRQNLPKTTQDRLFQYTVVQYVWARENYTWEGINANYLRASAMSAPAERERYQDMVNDKKNPDSPLSVYGEGPSSSKADVTDIKVRINPASPNAVDAMFVLRVTTPGRPPMTIRKTARMTWMAASDKISADIQQLYDPAGIAFTYYSSSADPKQDDK